MVMEPAVDPQARSPACPIDEELRAFSLGDMPEDQIDAVRQHLDACPVCEARAETLDDRTDHVLEELRRSLTSSERRRSADEQPVSVLEEGPPILPDYVIEGPPIGVGSTGLIYKARHVKLGRPAALKMIARRPDVVSRLFEIEAKAVAQLQHPNIVQIYDIGSDGDRPFLALELVDGGSLEGRMAGQPFPTTAAVETILIVAEAVEHAHRQGIVHCDLKPSNILTTRDGTPKIADFGVAKWTESDGYWGEDGGRRGTPRYMAPEQAGAPGEVGPATDVYSLGTILYEMLVGQVPHPGATSADTLRSLKEVDPPPPGRLRPDIPRELDRIVLRCLRKHPDDRYASAQALADDLRRFLRSRSSSAVSPRGRLTALVASTLGVVALSQMVTPTVDISPAPPAIGSAPLDDPGRANARDPELTNKTLVQEDGSIRLGAASAVLSGESLRFEGSFGNLGYWHGDEEMATWTFLIETENAGPYRMGLEYANRNGEAGNRYEVQIDGRSFVQVAKSTGGWSVYRNFPISDVDLAPGFHTIRVRPREPLQGALFDLRAVILAPVEP